MEENCSKPAYYVLALLKIKQKSRGEKHKAHRDSEVRIVWTFGLFSPSSDLLGGAGRGAGRMAPLHVPETLRNHPNRPRS